MPIIRRHGFNPNCDEINAIINNAMSAYENAKEIPTNAIYNYHKAFGDICMCRYMENHIFKDETAHIPSITGKNGFYDRFIKICEKKNINPDTIIYNLDLPDIMLGYWQDGGEVSSDILIRLSEQLDVSIDFLLKGKENDDNER